MIVKPALPEKHWWRNFSTEEQKGYLHNHPHSHLKELPPENVIDYDPFIIQVANASQKYDNLGIGNYLDRHLNEEEKTELDNVVNGKYPEYHKNLKPLLKKVMLTSLTAIIATVGLVLHPLLLLACYAAFKVAGKSPERWLFSKINAAGGNSYEAVEKAFKDQKFHSTSLSDDQLNEHLDKMDIHEIVASETLPVTNAVKLRNYLQKHFGLKAVKKDYKANSQVSQQHLLGSLPKESMAEVVDYLIENGFVPISNSIYTYAYSNHDTALSVYFRDYTNTYSVVIVGKKEK